MGNRFRAFSAPAFQITEIIYWNISGLFHVFESLFADFLCLFELFIFAPKVTLLMYFKL